MARKVWMNGDPITAKDFNRFEEALDTANRADQRDHSTAGLVAAAAVAIGATSRRVTRRGLLGFDWLKGYRR